MLHDFLTDNRGALIARCRGMVGERTTGVPLRELDYGVSPFLDQLIKTLQLEQDTDRNQAAKVSGPSGGQVANSEVSGTATEHGRELLRHGYTIEEVVHDYGDLCQAITGLAVETGADISADEFRTLNRCLDNAIAVAVTEFTYRSVALAEERQTNEIQQRLGFFAHELRNLVSTATLALQIIRSGNVGLAGATGKVLDRSLLGLGSLIDRELAQVRLSSGAPVDHQVFSLAGFVAELRLSASLEADVRHCLLVVAAVDRELALSGDRDLLLAAAGNLLQNAFKFTHAGSEVTLSAYAVGARIHIDVEDRCGGLPRGDVDTIFQPGVRQADNNPGHGLGLSIARRSVEANGGVLTVRDLPGTGCVFTIDLPRYATVPLAADRIVPAR
jgi:signal transduction histidine kinase